VGKNKKSDAWHYNHMLEPSSLSPGSIMPNYPWLLENDLDIASTPSKIKAMITLGVPYPKGYENKATDDLMKQANQIAEGLANEKIKTPATKEIVALIAYLQRLGKDISVEEKKLSETK
jgi:cytochrome c oxidase cbb3-type subunit I/II